MVSALPEDPGEDPVDLRAIMFLVRVVMEPHWPHGVPPGRQRKLEATAPATTVFFVKLLV